MRFKCVWSKFVTSVSAFTFALLAFALYGLGSGGHTVVFSLVSITMLVCLAYSPIYVEVTEDCLTIKRVFGSVIILRKDIELIRPYTSPLGIRKFGSGGFLGFLGWFSNSELGNFLSYSTDEKSQILIVTKQRKYLISCENREEFLRKFL